MRYFQKSIAQDNYKMSVLYIANSSNNLYPSRVDCSTAPPPPPRLPLMPNVGTLSSG